MRFGMTVIIYVIFFMTCLLSINDIVIWSVFLAVLLLYLKIVSW